MSSYTYPIRQTEGNLTPEQVHLLLANPTVVARRIAELTNMKFIADYLLSGKYDATGGGVFYETGEPAFVDDQPRAVSPGAEYPKAVMTAGEITAAKTVKWGLETDVTDERIARQGMDPVNKALARLANTVVRHVDSVAWGVITSKVTSTKQSAAWTAPSAIIESILAIQTERAALGTGLNLSTVVLSGAQYAKVMGVLLDKGVLPREDANPVLSGTMPVNAFGLDWVTSPHVTGTDPWLIDREQLGGVGDERLGSPGYTTASGTTIEVQSIRHKDDKYELRARRVCVPVVVEPLAGVKITGTGL